MEITSLQFALFSMLIVAIYYSVPGELQNHILLIASYFFLMIWNIQFVFVFFVLISLNFIIGQIIEKKQKNIKYALYLGVLINVLVIGFFKYADFFIANAINVLQQLGLSKVEGGLRLLLPLGLSFFVVKAISYLIDVNRGVIKASTNFVDFSLYMVYFPFIAAGPIERFREFSPRIKQKRSFDVAQIHDGMGLIFQGLARKIIIANLLFILLPSSVFSHPKAYSAPELVVWLLVYGFALYNDFAGYTSFARGLSTLFGIPLAINFNVPYLANNFNEFWQKWHITLSNWLRDYIFMPTSRTLLRHDFSRNHPLSVILPPMTTMLVSALWHSISWNMLVWGGMHGLYLVGERVFYLNRPFNPSQIVPIWKRVPSTVLVFGLTMIAWVPFRTNMSSALEYWSTLISPAKWQIALSNLAVLQQLIFNKFGVEVLMLVGLSVVLDMVHIRFGEQAIQRCPTFIQALLINAMIFALIIASLVQNQPDSFVYQGF